VTDRTAAPATERRMEEAAIRLLQEKGVLAGLNLREVAEAADVTRGLVYHHFGSRRGLLRSALRNSSYPRRALILKRRTLPPGERLGDFLRHTIKQPTSVQLLTLLILDGDEGVIGLPFAEDTIRGHREDMAAGLRSDELSPEVLTVGIAAAVFGWAIYRRSFANSVGVDAETLDAGVEQLFKRMSGFVEQTPSDTGHALAEPAAQDADPVHDDRRPLLDALGVRFDRYGSDESVPGWSEAEWMPSTLATAPAGVVPTGVHAVVLDAAMNVAVDAAVPGSDHPRTSLECKTETIRRARPGEALRVRGEVTRLVTRQLAYAEAWVLSADGSLVSRATSTFLLDGSTGGVLPSPG
jgi:AcrR family transcriptional regulator